MYRYISFITSVAFIDSMELTTADDILLRLNQKELVKKLLREEFDKWIMASCPFNSIFDPNRHLCYWPSSLKQSFQAHEVYCEIDNGIVITIDSSQTETFINETIPWDQWFAGQTNYDIFIGRIDVFKNKQFYQLESIPLDHTMFSSIASNQDSLDCCILYGSGAPRMDDCSNTQQAICSIGAISQSDCPTQGEFFDYRCYWPLTTPNSAENQLVSCSNDFGTLAIFHNSSTIDQVVAEFSNWGLSTPWIGINDLDTEGIYKESFEIKYTTFEPWATTEPGTDTEERCVERWSKDGFWNDLRCTESRLSICQKPGTMPETTTELSTLSTGSETSTESTSEINTLKTSTEASTESATAIYTLSTSTGSSTCKCTCKTNITISDEELTKKLEEIRNVLFIPKNSTKAFLRTKTSTYEDRPVAKGLGSIGIAIIVIVVTLIVCIDVSSLIAKRGS